MTAFQGRKGNGGDNSVTDLKQEWPIVAVPICTLELRGFFTLNLLCDANPRSFVHVLGIGY